MQFETTEEIDRLFHTVFGSPAGKKVLTFMLRDLGYATTIEPGNVGQATLQNYAKRLLDHCGILRDEMLDRVIDKYFELPPPWAAAKEKGEPIKGSQEGAKWGNG